MRTIELQGVDNVRDLGAIPVAGGRRVKKGLILRGGSLHAATERDRDVLFGQLGVKRVIDVRCGWERKEKPDVQVAGVENLHIPFYDLEIVGIEYTEPAAGTKTVGRDVACEPGHFYRSLANPLTVGQMRRGIDAVFSAACEGGPVYLHCSGGKDRVGILALLVLTVLGADEDVILDDYLLTNASRDKNYAKMFERFVKFAEGDEKLADELVRAHRALPANIATFREAVAEAYGSMEEFVHDQLALDDERLAFIRARCTE